MDRLRFHIAWVIALVATLAVAGTTAAEAKTKATLSERTREALASGITTLGDDVLSQSTNTWLDAYTRSRIEAAEPGIDPMPDADAAPVAYDPSANQRYDGWTAQPDFWAEEARDDGSLTEWADHYYISHWWSDYGQQTLAMRPGDRLSVNGRSIVVQGVFDYPKDSFYEEVMHLLGTKAVVLQTCIPDSTYNRIVYGW